MADIEKVIKGLNSCARTDGKYCGNCPYTNEGDCVAIMSQDVLALLKEQEAVVRCKDCKHGRIYENCVKCENAGNPGMFATYHQFNWFCADGEAKE